MRLVRLRALAAASVGFALLTLVSPTAQASTEVTAQFNPGTNTYLPVHSTVSRAQIFTATVGGVPSSVDLYINRSGTTTVGVDVQIQGVAAGVPDGVTLAMGNIPSGAIPVGVGNFMSSVQLSGATALVAGNQYAIVVASATVRANDSTNIYQLQGGLKSGYTGGETATRSSGVWAVEIRWGYWFRVFVSVPTPEPDVPVVGGPQTVDFTYWTPSGEQCDPVSPQRVDVGARVNLPDADVRCPVTPGAVIHGWTIPVPTGFTGAGSEYMPFAPGQAVVVVESQRFTAVVIEPTILITYDANVGNGVRCIAGDALDTADDSRLTTVEVPRVNVAETRFTTQSVCIPPGHALAGWNSSGDGSGVTFELGSDLPLAWQQAPVNERVLYAVWTAA